MRFTLLSKKRKSPIIGDKAGKANLDKEDLLQDLSSTRTTETEDDSSYWQSDISESSQQGPQELPVSAQPASPSLRLEETNRKVLVKFSLEQDQVIEHPHCNDPLLDLRDCWYSTEEYLGFKQEAVMTAKYLVRQETTELNEKYLKIVKNMYLSCCQVAVERDGMDAHYSSTAVVEGLNMTQRAVFKTCMLEYDQDGRGFGLERLIIRVISQDLPRRKKAIYQAIKEIQESTDSTDSREGMIAQQVACATLQDCLFAAEKALAMSNLCYC